MTTPETLYEAASYELKQFRERRMAERRAMQRDTPDRRVSADAREKAKSEKNPPDQMKDFPGPV